MELSPRKLSRAIQIAYAKMEWARKARMKFMKQYCGRFYGKQDDHGQDQRSSPLNKIWLGVTTIVPNLTFNDPMHDVGSQYVDYRDYAEIFGLGLDHVTKRIGYRMTIRKAITDACFFAGILKSGLGVSDQTIDLEGTVHEIGEPFLDRIDPDDFFMDAAARSIEEAEFIGHRFRMRREKLLETELFDPALVERLPGKYNMGSDFRHEAESLSMDKMGMMGKEEVGDYVDLCEVYCPYDGSIKTLPWGYGNDNYEFIREVEYDGPKKGPYHMLGFAWLPNNPLPIPPVGIWYDLHMIGNRLARKIVQQVERAKSVLAYERGAIEDAQEIVDADDGSTVGVDQIDAVKEVSYGGTRSEQYEAMQWMDGEFNKQSGNLDAIGGLQEDSDTATQAQMLRQGQGVRVADMQNLTYQWASDGSRDLGYWIHTDPLMNLALGRRVPGQFDSRGRPVFEQVFYSPEMKQGDFYDFAIDVKMYSMDRKDPKEEVKNVTTFSTQVLPALAQTFQLLGPIFNLEKTAISIARKMGITDLDEVINSGELQRLMQMRMAAIGAPNGNVGQFANSMGGGAGGMPQITGGGSPQQPNPRQMTGDGMNADPVQQDVQQGAPQPAAMALNR